MKLPPLPGRNADYLPVVAVEVGVGDAAVTSTPSQDPILLACGEPHSAVEDVK
jgi:hypothetical protein